MVVADTHHLTGIPRDAFIFHVGRWLRVEKYRLRIAKRKDKPSNERREIANLIHQKYVERDAARHARGMATEDS